MKLTQNMRMPTKDRSEKNRKYGRFGVKTLENMLVQLFLSVSAAKTSIRVGNTSTSSATLAGEPMKPFLCLTLINRRKLVVLLISPHESLIGLSQRFLR